MEVKPVTSKYLARAFDVLIGDIKDQNDCQLFFPVWEDYVLHVPYDWNFSKVLCYLNIFPSGREAKRCGWMKPIDQGFHDFFIGKHRITIIKTEWANQIDEPYAFKAPVDTVEESRKQMVVNDGFRCL